MGDVIPLVRKLDQGRCCVCGEPTESGLVLTSADAPPLLVSCCRECFRGEQPEGATGPCGRAVARAFSVAVRAGTLPGPAGGR